MKGLSHIVQKCQRLRVRGYETVEKFQTKGWLQLSLRENLLRKEAIKGPI